MLPSQEARKQPKSSEAASLECYVFTSADFNSELPPARTSRLACTSWAVRAGLACGAAVTSLARKNALAGVRATLGCRRASDTSDDKDFRALLDDA